MFRNYVIYLTYFYDRVFINIFRYTGIRYEWIDFIVYIDGDELKNDEMYMKYIKNYRIDNLIRHRQTCYVCIPEQKNKSLESFI